MIDACRTRFASLVILVLVSASAARPHQAAADELPTRSPNVVIIFTDDQGYADDHQTLVVFTSDNGPWLIKGEHGGSAGPLREGKGTSFEGGHRVPCIMSWPETIPAGRICCTVATTMDLLPTIAHLARAKLPADRIIDGQDIRPLLFGQQVPLDFHKPVLFYLGSALHAVRWNKWKLHVPHRYNRIRGARIATKSDSGKYVNDTIALALFDLENDLGETVNVAEAHPDVIKRLMTLIEEARDDLGDSLTHHKGKNTCPAGESKELREGKLP